MTGIGYWIRPYDMLLDARRWRWQKSGHQRQTRWLAQHRDQFEAAVAAAIVAGQCDGDCHERDTACPGCDSGDWWKACDGCRSYMADDAEVSG